MTSRNYFGKMNSILGSVVPLAMFAFLRPLILVLLAFKTIHRFVFLGFYVFFWIAALIYFGCIKKT